MVELIPAALLSMISRNTKTYDKQSKLLDYGKVVDFMISTRTILRIDQHEPLPLTDCGNIDSSHTIYIYVCCIVDLLKVYDI